MNDQVKITHNCCEAKLRENIADLEMPESVVVHLLEKRLANLQKLATFLDDLVSKRDLAIAGLKEELSKRHDACYRGGDSVLVVTLESGESIVVPDVDQGQVARLFAAIDRFTGMAPRGVSIQRATLARRLDYVQGDLEELVAKFEGMAREGGLPAMVESCPEALIEAGKKIGAQIEKERGCRCSQSGC